MLFVLRTWEMTVSHICAATGPLRLTSARTRRRACRSGSARARGPATRASRTRARACRRPAGWSQGSSRRGTESVYFSRQRQCSGIEIVCPPDWPYAHRPSISGQKRCSAVSGRTSGSSMRRVSSGARRRAMRSPGRVRCHRRTASPRGLAPYGISTSSPALCSPSEPTHKTRYYKQSRISGKFETHTHLNKCIVESVVVEKCAKFAAERTWMKLVKRQRQTPIMLTRIGYRFLVSNVLAHTINNLKNWKFIIMECVWSGKLIGV